MKIKNFIVCAATAIAVIMCVYAAGELVHHCYMEVLMFVIGAAILWGFNKANYKEGEWK